MYWFRKWLRDYLYRLLDMHLITKYSEDARFMAADAKVKVGSLELYLEKMRQTTFAGSTNDGIKNELIIIHHDTVANEWKIVYDNGLRSQTYMGLLKELREKIHLYNARYVAVNAGNNVLDIKARMGLDTRFVPETVNSSSAGAKDE